MPEYNGPVYFPAEVLVHLLRNYVAWVLVFAILLPAPFAVATALRGDFEGAIESWLPVEFWSLSSWLSFAHVMTFFMFKYYFAPRFPYTSPYTTLALAAPIGALLLGLNWTLIGGGIALDSLVPRFLWAAILSVGVAAFGTLAFFVFGWGVLRWGPGRWLGWFIVGRKPYDAFVAAEIERTAPPRSA